ncbi:MAG: hypothetical protein JW744_03420 [Candidatus Diapherotrites archaeon]|uniref:Uncharacterized protein n=1 Tax=Candidatus Iainarchaeum sp. TaxID=3101447 RepID=A0A938YWN3_9ARCH|nr:hypothetical protein [Candidatus Diapherotrites archaeon]
MAREIVSSFVQLQRMLPKGFEGGFDSTRLVASKHYLSKGGVLHVSALQNEWPRLLYPTRAHLKKKVEELDFLKAQYATRLSDWKKKFNEAKSYHTVQNIKKLKEPLFWQHMAKCAVDKDYRADSDKVKLPVSLVADRRWKPMIKVFLNDLDYRKQLVQTVEESIVYKESKKVAQYADLLQNFRMEQSNRKIDELERKIADLDADITAMHELSKWASF